MSVLAAATVIALQALGASSASAAAICPTAAFVVDSTAHVWDFDRFSGVVGDGGGSDAYDGWGELFVNNSFYVVPDANCTVTGRQYALPEAEMSGLQVSRKVFAPTEGIAFARWITFLRNPTTTPIKVQLTFRGNLGSQANTKIPRHL